MPWTHLYRGAGREKEGERDMKHDKRTGEGEHAWTRHVDAPAHCCCDSTRPFWNDLVPRPPTRAALLSFFSCLPSLKPSHNSTSSSNTNIFPYTLSWPPPPPIPTPPLFPPPPALAEGFQCIRTEPERHAGLRGFRRGGRGGRGRQVSHQWVPSLPPAARARICAVVASTAFLWGGRRERRRGGRRTCLYFLARGA